MFNASLRWRCDRMKSPKDVVKMHKIHRRCVQACSWSCFGAKASESESESFGCGSEWSSPVLKLVNTVGVIGGVSAVSTLNFLEKLVEEEEESLPFIVCNDPVLSRELSAHKRNRTPYANSRTSTSSQFDHHLILQNLRQKRLFLERAGARCIAMPCHISHTWHADISQGCSVPFLHLAECVATELQAANLKPLEAGSNVRIGILATHHILTAGFYQDKLLNQGFEVVLPDEATMDHAIIPAIEASARGDMEGARNLLRVALQVLLVRAANTVIIASDDIRVRLFLPPDDPLLKKCTDPMDALVRSTIRWAAESSAQKDEQ